MVSEVPQGTATASLLRRHKTERKLSRLQAIYCIEIAWGSWPWPSCCRSCLVIRGEPRNRTSLAQTTLMTQLIPKRDIGATK